MTIENNNLLLEKKIRKQKYYFEKDFNLKVNKIVHLNCFKKSRK